MSAIWVACFLNRDKWRRQNRIGASSSSELWPRETRSLQRIRSSKMTCIYFLSILLLNCQLTYPIIIPTVNTCPHRRHLYLPQVLRWATLVPEATPTTPVSAEALILLENATHLTRPIMIMAVTRTMKEAGTIRIEGAGIIPITAAMVVRMMVAGHVRVRDITPIRGQEVERTPIIICPVDSLWCRRV